jgi:hypothetical protein
LPATHSRPQTLGTAGKKAVSWDTKTLENGEYQILGLMHVSVKTEDEEVIVARQNIVDVVVEN